KPFAFEGAKRRLLAEQGIQDLVDKVDTLITIPNDRLLQVAEKRTTMVDAFRIVDDVLRQGVQGISDLITVPGLINLDFADVKTIMTNAGSALMGIGHGTGETRAAAAARQAIMSPPLTRIDPPPSRRNAESRPAERETAAGGNGAPAAPERRYAADDLEVPSFLRRK